MQAKNDHFINEKMQKTLIINLYGLAVDSFVIESKSKLILLKSWSDQASLFSQIASIFRLISFVK